MHGHSMLLVAATMAAAALGGPPALADVGPPATGATAQVRGVHAGGPARRFTVAPGADLTVLFTAVPGQTVRATVSEGTYPGACAARVWLVSPSGTALTEAVCGGRGAALPAVTVRGSGLHGVRVDSQGRAGGSVTVAVTSTGPTTITPNIGAREVVVAAGSSADLAFRFEEGEFAHVDLLDPSPWGADAARAEVIGPDGVGLAWALDHTVPRRSGVHRVHVVNPGSAPRRLGVALVKGRDAAAALQPGGAAVRLDLDLPGRQGRLTFPATAGDRVLLAPSWPGAAPPVASAQVLGPDGEPWASVSRLDTTVDVGPTVATSGVQTLVVDLPGTATGTLELAVRLLRDPEPVSATLGVPVTLEAAQPWAVPSLTLDVTRGAGYVMAFESSLDLDVRVLGPHGEQVVTNWHSPRQPLRMPVSAHVTGRHRILVDPAGGTTGPVTVTLTAIPDRGIRLGVPRSVAIGDGDESTVVLEVDPELSGAPLAVHVTGSDAGPLAVGLNAAGRPWVRPTLLLPAGDATGVLPGVPSPGLYELWVVNHGAAGTFTLTLEEERP
ncbi:MAG: hypothetical protein U0Q15_14815 [Kineosporiaceae bacterium]